jgi:cytochrome bd-type quinol oxidase subunit 2
VLWGLAFASALALALGWNSISDPYGNGVPAQDVVGLLVLLANATLFAASVLIGYDMSRRPGRVRAFGWLVLTALLATLGGFLSALPWLHASEQLDRGPNGGEGETILISVATQLHQSMSYLAWVAAVCAIGLLVGGATSLIKRFARNT